jgi:preprotein translocase subunit SecE
MAKANIGEFFQQVRQEAGKVTWPSRKETLITTGMVFLMVIACSIFFLLVDLVFTKLSQLLLGIGG